MPKRYFGNNRMQRSKQSLNVYSASVNLSGCWPTVFYIQLLREASVLQLDWLSCEHCFNSYVFQALSLHPPVRQVSSIHWTANQALKQPSTSNKASDAASGITINFTNCLLSGFIFHALLWNYSFQIGLDNHDDTIFITVLVPNFGVAVLPNNCFLSVFGYGFAHFCVKTLYGWAHTVACFFLHTKF